MVEQRPFKPLVGGSSPPAPTTVFRGFIPQHSAILAVAQLRAPEILSHTPDKSWFHFRSLKFRGNDYGYSHG